MIKKMPFLTLIILLVMPCFVMAQSVVTEPKTAVKAEVKVAIEIIKKGPYAKFAQQYLGVTAPLNDRTTYSIVSSGIDSYNENVMISVDELTVENKKVQATANECVGADLNNMFLDMGINPIVFSSTSLMSGSVSTQEKTLEEMASDAAAAIFSLRRRRFDLITGELGENVFGAGLEAAIEEMARIEKEYLELFVGKRTISYKDYTYDISPEKGKTSYILARFSNMGGMVEPTDMNGDPVVLTVTPENKVSQLPTESGKRTDTKKYIVADMAACKLFLSDELLSSARLGIYQFGVIIEK